ncbi:hypothetical protein FA13DRAFT_1263802 [Coprinellus micaceus]|uniref:Uncharacterized protein n=1 Tax=Coprinellus micaceus TaxID=71717 RepID=A0A4Y7R863_COPMI|nr:hypothetical protein FA13DRAFT_1263802 [Coprinellus micaceus]
MRRVALSTLSHRRTLARAPKHFPQQAYITHIAKTMPQFMTGDRLRRWRPYLSVLTLFTQSIKNTLHLSTARSPNHHHQPTERIHRLQAAPWLNWACRCPIIPPGTPHCEGLRRAGRMRRSRTAATSVLYPFSHSLLTPDTHPRSPFPEAFVKARDTIRLFTAPVRVCISGRGIVLGRGGV